MGMSSKQNFTVMSMILDCGTFKLNPEPRLNGKAERSHKTDQQEFYQLLECSGDVDLGEKLNSCEYFCNFDGPYGGLAGKTPY